MRVTFAYLETLGTGPGDSTRLAADLPLGLATVRAYAQRRPRLRGRLAAANRTVPGRLAPREAARRILAASPDLAAFGVYLWNIEETTRLCRELKRQAPGTTVVVGGPEVPRAPADLRAFLRERPCVDIAVSGEGEEAFAEALEGRLGGGRLGGIPGLGLRERGSVTAAEPRPGVASLAGIPGPFAAGAAAVRPGARGMLCVEGSRGCPFACSYCDFLSGTHKLRLFPLERVRAELDALWDAGFRGSVCFTDAMLNARKDRALDLFRLMRRHDLEYQLELKPELFDDELIAALGRVRRVFVSLGIQSVNPKALKNMNRGLDLARAARNIRGLAARPNIRVRLELILGLPGDDHESFKRTLDWALPFAPRADLTLYDLSVLPNAPLAAQRGRFGLRTDGRGVVLSSTGFSAADMARSSRLFAAYRHLRGAPGCWPGFERVLRGGTARPSEALEKIAQRLISAGRLPKGRIYGTEA